MQWIRQRGKIRFYKKFYSQLYSQPVSTIRVGNKSRIIKNVIAVDVRAVSSGCLLSYKMEVIYGRKLLLVGACGNEDWQMLPFCLDAQSGIVSDCENAKEYRKLIGLQI